MANTMSPMVTIIRLTPKRLRVVLHVVFELPAFFKSSLSLLRLLSSLLLGRPSLKLLRSTGALVQVLPTPPQVLLRQMLPMTGKR